MNDKLAAVAGLRNHLHDQFCDRAAAWQLQDAAMDSLSGLMVVCTDGCDQSKFMMPRDPEFRVSAALIFGCYNVCHACPSLLCKSLLLMQGATPRDRD